MVYHKHHPKQSFDGKAPRLFGYSIQSLATKGLTGNMQTWIQQFAAQHWITARTFKMVTRIIELWRAVEK
jgi:hypothetical protein